MKKTLQTLLSLLTVFILLFALSSALCAGDGALSVEIGEDGIAWLKESSDGTETWYGIESEPGMFAPGSRFWIKWIDRGSDPEAWQEVYHQLDEEYKKTLGENVTLFTAGVTDPDGIEYTRLNKPVNLYIQLGDDWDTSDVEALFADSGDDERVESFVTPLLMAGTGSPAGSSNYVTVTLRHFGGTLLVGEFEADIPGDDLGLGSSISDASFPSPWLIVTVVAVLAAAFFVVFFLVRKKKKSA